jgi:hypothetical protein
MEGRALHAQPAFALRASCCIQRADTHAPAACPPPGALPEAWASPSAFPSLALLSIMGANLSGSLPPSWGAPGALLNLTDLILSGAPAG